MMDPSSQAMYLLKLHGSVREFKRIQIKSVEKAVRKEQFIPKVSKIF
jgi:hypothetical protein